MTHTIARSSLLLIALTLAACGGGGSGSSGGSSVTPSTPSNSSSSTVTTSSITGTVTDFSAGTPLAGFTVTVGALPTASSCLATQSATAEPCGVPASPLPTVTTSATGTFSITVPSTGTYMLTIGKDGTYATLHRSINVTASSTPLGTLKLTAINSDEQAWLADVNNQRATVSVPASFSNLVIDEYAEEQAQQWAIDTVSGKTAYTDAGYEPYQLAYASDPGAIYGATGVLAVDLASNFPNHSLADTEWMAEKANCPSGNWQTCSFTNAGHYINISNTDTVWVGLGEYANASESSSAYYDLMLVENYVGTGPA